MKVLVRETRDHSGAPAPASHPAALVLLPLACAAILLLLIVGNGYPLLYDDTTAYMRRSAGALVALLGPGFGSEWLDVERLEWLQVGLEESAEGVGATSRDPPPWHSGRSIYYGTTIYMLALAGGLWASAAVQALVGGVLLYVAWFRVLRLRSVPLFLAFSLALAFASSLGYFVGLVMPDVFAGFTILSLALLVAGWDRLRLAGRGVLAGIAVFSLLAHDTHLLVGAGLFAGMLLLRLWKRGGGTAVKPGRNAVLTVAGCLALAAIGGLAFHVAAVRITGERPLRLPHITAHMASLEPSAAFLKERCTREDWAVCKYADRLPMTWIEFMFSPETYDGAPIEEKRRLSDEQLEVAGAMLRDRPATTLGLIASEATRQLTKFSYYDLGQRNQLLRKIPGEARARIQETVLVRNPALVPLLSVLQQAVVIVCIPILLVLGLTGGDRSRSWSKARALATFILAGVVINAIVCGVLAYPYDRFQTRVVWLVPFVTFTWLALLFERRQRLRAERSETALAPA